MEMVKTVQLEDIQPYNYVLHRIQSGRSWSFPRHRHHRVFEFYYLFGGKISHHFDGGDLLMEAGDLIMVGEEDFHSVEGRNFDFFNLILPVDYWSRFLETLGLVPVFAPFCSGDCERYTAKMGQAEWIVEDLDRLFQYQRSSYGDILLGRFLLNLAAELQGPPDNPEQGREERPSWMESLFLEVENRGLEDIGIADLAKIADRTPEHLARSFRRFLGLTPSAWLNRQKLERAALLLEHSNTPVLDIALSLGFDNLGYFYRLFRERYAMPPAEYRKRKSLVPFWCEDDKRGCR